MNSTSPAKPQTYLVGGAVRDELLGYPFHERDWVVVGATPQAMLDQGYQQVGKDFPVYLHPDTKEEYALARTERKNGPGYTGFACYAAPDVTLEQDLERRDLTINAIAKADDGTLTDPFGGCEDITNKVLRHVSPAFEEDPLRVLRTARFAARYAHIGFSIAQETLQLMQKISASGELSHLAAERIFTETEKGLSEQSPTVYIDALLQCGALAAIAPAWALSLNNNVISTVENQKSTITEASERFALLCLNLTSADITGLSDTIRLPNDWLKAAKNLVEGLEKLNQIASNNLSTDKANALLSLLKKLDCQRRPEQLVQFLRLATAAGESKILVALLEKSGKAICQIQAKDLIAEGFTGAALGNALAERQASAINALLQ